MEKDQPLRPSAQAEHGQAGRGADVGVLGWRMEWGENLELRTVIQMGNSY